MQKEKINNQAELGFKSQVQAQAFLVDLALKNLPATKNRLPLSKLRSLLIPSSHVCDSLPIEKTIKREVQYLLKDCSQNLVNVTYKQIMGHLGEQIRDLVNLHIDGVVLPVTECKEEQKALVQLYESYGNLLIDHYGKLTFNDLEFAFELYSAGKLPIRLNTHQGKFTRCSLNSILKSYVLLREASLKQVKNNIFLIQERMQN